MIILATLIIILLINGVIIYFIFKKIKSKKENKTAIIIGSIWGSINEVFYMWLLFASAFSSSGWKSGLLSQLYTQAPLTWQVFCFPMYLVDRLIFYPIMKLVPYDFSSLHPILQLSFFIVLLPLIISIIFLFSITISVGIGYLINKIKKR